MITVLFGFDDCIIFENPSFELIPNQDPTLKVIISFTQNPPVSSYMLFVHSLLVSSDVL